MLRVHGFYGHVRQNDLRSVAMFAGFLVAFQLVTAMALALPLLFIDSRHSPLLGPLGYLARYGPFVLAAGVGLFLLRFTRHVSTVRATVDFAFVDRRAEPRLVNIVEQQAIAAGLPLPRVGIIESDARNAFACGLTAASSVVVATRGLVEALDDDELAAVVAHEIAHIRNGDIRLMAAANVLMENLAFVQRRNLLRVEGWGRILLVVLMPPLLVLVLLAGFVVTVAFTLARLSRLLIASSREFVADAEAVRMTHDPGALISALRAIEGRSLVPGLPPQADAMMIDGAAVGAHASHPTIAERIEALTRLAGAMATDPRPRRDTRPLAQVMAHRPTAFGRRRDDLPPMPAPATLLNRVRADADRNIFGLTPRAKRRLVFAFGGLAAIQMLFFLSLTFRTSPPARATPQEAAEAMRGPQSGMIGAAPLRPTVQAIDASLAPAPARKPTRCFSTDHYRVGDRGLQLVGAIDPARVERHAAPRDDSSDITMERYLGLRLRSVRQVERAGEAALDAALLAYASTRKTLLQVTHRFFGAPGLELMREAYRSETDRAVLETLRRRLAEGAPALLADRAKAAELRFLADDPDAFLPCIATGA